MRITKWLFYTIASLSLLTMATGCGQPEPVITTDGQYQDEPWRISGRLATPGYSNGEMVAVGLDGVHYRTEIASDSSFGIELPGNSSYAVYFFASSGLDRSNVIANSEIASGAVGPDLNQENWALLHFEDSPEFGLRNTLRLPWASANYFLDFGDVAVQGNHAFPTINPSDSLDYDGDGLPDAVDSDDQNDGRNDSEQKNELEIIEICHFTANNVGTTHLIPLASLFQHMSHGDTVGACSPANRIPPLEQPSPTGRRPMPERPAPEGSKADPMVNPAVVIEETPDEEEGNEDATGDRPKEEMPKDKADSSKDEDDKMADPDADDEDEKGDEDGRKESDKDDEESDDRGDHGDGKHDGDHKDGKDDAHHDENDENDENEADDDQKDDKDKKKKKKKRDSKKDKEKKSKKRKDRKKDNKENGL